MRKLKIFSVMLVALSLILVVASVYAAEMSAEFKSVLTDGKLVLKSFQPTNSVEALVAVEMNVPKKYAGFSVDSTSFNSDYTSCDLTYTSTGETHTVEISYVYDADTKKIVDSYASKFSSGTAKFQVKDMDIVNFWINAKGNPETLLNYSEEFSKQVDYKNFDISLAAGSGAEFHVMSQGYADFNIDDTIYAVTEKVSVEAKNVLYVSSDTKETKEALVAAIQTRIDNAVGKGVVTVSAGANSVEEFLGSAYDALIADAQDKLDQALAATPQDDDLIANLQNELVSYQKAKQDYMESLKDENNAEHFVKDAIGGFYFIAKIANNEHYFTIQKSDDIVEATTEHTTKDITTDITVSTTSKAVPLDAKIEANKVTEGTEYNRIVKILNVETYEMYDISLYSKTADTYVTRLNNGTFEVKIPLDEKFEGKDLIVYYTDADGNVTEHEVTVKDGFAVFTTNHFSIYTLAVKPELDPTPPTGANNSFLQTISMVVIITLAGIVLLKSMKIQE